MALVWAELPVMPVRRTLAVTISGLLAAALLAITPIARAASPSSGSLNAVGDEVTWTGGPFATPVSDPVGLEEACQDPADPSCDRYALTVGAQSGPTTLVVTIKTENGEVDDYDLAVYGPDGKELGSSGDPGTPPDGESVAIGLPDPGTYSVRVHAYSVLPGSTYSGAATLVAGGEKTYGEADSDVVDCFEATPDKVGVSGVTDDGRTISLDVTVLLDEGVSEPRAREVMTYAKKSYAPLDIDLNVTRYLIVDVPDDGTAKKGDLTVGTALGSDLIAAAKAMFGGVRPADSDLVYLLTNKDTYSLTEEAAATGETDDDGDGRVDEDKRDYGLLGLADCIGGVRFADHAFAIGELGDELAFGFGPATFRGNAGSKTASHEIGHLMGAHHHYFDCAEGLATETEEGEVSPCTIMAPFVDLGSINFGVVDGAAVRGHAVAYAGDNDALAAASRAAAERGPAATVGARGPGYALLGGDGGLFTFGAAEFHGSTGNLRLNQPVVGMAWTPTGKGYWIVARDGGIFTFGDAAFHGSTGGMRLNSPILGMEATPSGRGYWLVAGDGGIFTFGDAAFHGSMGDRRLNAPVVGLGTTSTGKGYWLVARDGGIFTFGDAAFHGSTGNVRLNEPVFDLAPTSTDGGYWLVARDGGVFTFGDATFHGSAAARQASVIGLDATPTDRGYWVARGDGDVANFGDAPALGGLSGQRLNAPIVGFAAVPS
jgi:hypothetical protein